MEERNCYVYEDYRMDNWTCYYVGMGSKNEENGYNRFEMAERNDHHDRIMNKYGIVRTIIRDNLTREEANALEEARIYYYVFVLGYTIDIKGYRKGKKSDSHLTNQTWGGDGTKGRKPSEETRKKLSEAKQGKTFSEEHKKKLSEAKKGVNPYANKTEEELEEWKRKIGEARKGRNPYANKSEEEMKEIVKKISEARKGHVVSEETRKKMSEKSQGEKNPMYGRTGEKAPRARKVRCIETGEVFTTLKEACEWCGTHRSSIAKQIRGELKTTGKHPITGEKLHWEYVD